MLLLTVIIPHVCFYGSYDPQTQHVSPQPSRWNWPFFRLVISTSSKMSPVRFLQGRVLAGWAIHWFGYKECQKGHPELLSKRAIYIYIYISKSPIYNSLQVSGSVCLREIRLMLQKSGGVSYQFEKKSQLETIFRFFSSSLKRVRLFTRCPRKFQEQIFESLCLWVISTLGYN